jgi:hypothetical protein
LQHVACLSANFLSSSAASAALMPDGKMNRMGLASYAAGFSPVGTVHVLSGCRHDDWPGLRAKDFAGNLLSARRSLAPLPIIRSLGRHTTTPAYTANPT